MGLRRELIALAIRILHYESATYRKPDSFERFINELMGIESYDQRMARDIDAELERATEAVKRMNLNRKFKKITKNV